MVFEMYFICKHCWNFNIGLDSTKVPTRVKCTHWLANKCILHCMHSKCPICLFGKICVSLVFPGLNYIFNFFFLTLHGCSHQNWRLHMINVIRSESKISITATNKLNNVFNFRTQWRRYKNLNHYAATNSNQ